MTAPRALGALFVVALALGPTMAQDSPKKVKRDEVVARAYRRCHATDFVLQRLTLAPNEDSTLIAIAEYGSGDMGIFVGDDADPKSDMFAIIGSDNVPLLEEALKRSAGRRSSAR